jgi:hypothetical protein
MMAVFEDGTEQIVPELTVAALEAAQTRGPVDAYWTGEHSLTHNALVVKKRVDRHLLVSLYEQQRQICQVAVHWWFADSSVEHSPAEDEEAEQKALIFMKKFAIAYSQDDIGRDELYDQRDKLLNIDGLKMSRMKKVKQFSNDGVAKRPAAAPSASSTDVPKKKKQATTTEEPHVEQPKAKKNKKVVGALLQRTPVEPVVTSNANPDNEILPSGDGSSSASSSSEYEIAQFVQNFALPSAVVLPKDPLEDILQL